MTRWLAQALTWGSTLVIARLLAPEDYGIVAMAAVVVGFVAVVSELGVGVTVVTMRDLTSAQIAQLNGLAIVMGIAAFVMVAGSSPVMAAAYGRPALMPVIAAMAVTFLVAGPRTVPAALLQRDLHFRYLAVIESAQAIVGAAVTLVAAYAGWRYWSLVAGTIASACVLTMLTVGGRATAVAWPRRRSLGRALTFTGHQLTGTIAWYLLLERRLRRRWGVARRRTARRVLHGVDARTYGA